MNYSKNMSPVIMNSSAGVYIGIRGADGLPLARISNYYTNEKDARHALIIGWELRECPENKELNELLLSQKEITPVALSGDNMTLIVRMT